MVPRNSMFTAIHVASVVKCVCERALVEGKNN